jgi:hypothetical protein
MHVARFRTVVGNVVVSVDALASLNVTFNVRGIPQIVI